MSNEKKMWLGFALGWGGTLALYVRLLVGGARWWEVAIFIAVWLANVVSTWFVLNRRLK